MDTATLPLRIAVKPVPRRCASCLIVNRAVCVFCCSLVEDERGTRYVCLRPFTGERWRKVEIMDLVGCPRLLESDREGVREHNKTREFTA